MFSNHSNFQTDDNDSRSSDQQRVSDKDEISRCDAVESTASAGLPLNLTLKHNDVTTDNFRCQSAASTDIADEQSVVDSHPLSVETSLRQSDRDLSGSPWTRDDLERREKNQVVGRHGSKSGTPMMPGATKRHTSHKVESGKWLSNSSSLNHSIHSFIYSFIHPLFSLLCSHKCLRISCHQLVQLLNQQSKPAPFHKPVSPYCCNFIATSSRSISLVQLFH